MSDEFDRFLRNKLESVRESDAGALARKERLAAEQTAQAELFAVALRDWATAREALRILCEKVNTNLASVDVSVEHEDVAPGPDEIGHVVLRAFRFKEETGHVAQLSVAADGGQVVEFGGRSPARQIALLPVAQCTGSGYEPFIMAFLDAVLKSGSRR